MGAGTRRCGGSPVGDRGGCLQYSVMKRPTVEKSASAGEGRRCVLVIAVGAPIPASLLERLQRRGAVPVVVASPAAAMTALADAATHALIVQNPAKMGRFDELRHAVSTYHPSVVVWAYEPGDINGRHGRESGEAPAHLYRVPPLTRPRSKGGAPPDTDGDRTGVATEAAGMPHQDDDPLVTAEELRMLLDPIPAPDQGDAHAEGR